MRLEDLEGNLGVGVGAVVVVAGTVTGVVVGTVTVKFSCCVVFAGIGGACVTSADLKLIVGRSSGAEKGVNGVKGEKVVMIGPSDNRGAVEGAVELDCGGESGSMRADFGGTSGGSSDTTLCSLNLLSVRFGNISVCCGMTRGANCFPGFLLECIFILFMFGELDLLRWS